MRGCLPPFGSGRDVCESPPLGVVIPTKLATFCKGGEGRCSFVMIQLSTPISSGQVQGPRQEPSAGCLLEGGPLLMSGDGEQFDWDLWAARAAAETRMSRARQRSLISCGCSSELHSVGPGQGLLG